MTTEPKSFQNPRIQQFLNNIINDFLRNNKYATFLAQKIEHEVGSLFSNWIDTIILPNDNRTLKKIAKIGFIKHDTIKNYYYTPQFHFPKILVRENALEIIIYVESVSDFCRQHKLSVVIDGGVYATRKIQLQNHPDYILNIMEKSTLLPNILPTQLLPEKMATYLHAMDMWRNRNRNFSRPLEGLKQTLALSYRIVDMVGIDRAAHIILQVEREYWQFNCSIGNLQKFFQDKLGLGWGNCDYYAFWSNRETFSTLIQIFEVLGFRCTQKLFVKDYGNKGIQILEHLNSDILIMCAVHLKEKERKSDFAHMHLASIQKTGVIDNWLKRNGDSILTGGAKEIGLRCNVKKMQEHMKRYNVNFTSIVDTVFFKQAISNNFYPDQKENYLTIVEKKAGFKYFLFD